MATTSGAPARRCTCDWSDGRQPPQPHQQQQQQHQHPQQQGNSKACPAHWEERRLDLAARVRRQELIPRAKLRQKSPDSKSACLNERPLRATLSCCDRMTRPLQHPLRHTESTRLYPKQVNFEEHPRVPEEPIPNRYDTYNSKKSLPSDYGYSRLPPPRAVPESKQPEEESDIEYYTSSETGSQETVKYNGNPSKLGVANPGGIAMAEKMEPNNNNSSSSSSNQVSIVTGAQNKSGIQIVVQSPAEVEAQEAAVALADNLYAEIDLKIQAAPLEAKLEQVHLTKEPPKQENKAQKQENPNEIDQIKDTVLKEPLPLEEKVIVETSDVITKISEEVTILETKHTSSVQKGEINKVIKESKEEKDIKDENKPILKEQSEEKKEPVQTKIKVSDIINKVEEINGTKGISDKVKALEPKVEGKPPKAPQIPKMKLMKFNTIHPKMEVPEESPEQTFYEEEYSYEPELKRSSSKVVLRTRSLLNLDEDINSTLNNVVKKCAKGNRNKITTGPDGTFRFAGRKASSEMNLSDDSNPNSNNTSPKAIRHCLGEELRKRKEEIFKNKNATSEQNANRFNEEINSNNKETTKQRALNNLKKYLKGKNIGLREILVNNNVVIIEPVRSESNQSFDVSDYNHKNSADMESACRITGATVKPPNTKDPNKKPAVANTLPRASKPFQTTVQRHFFYHPIKNNRELKDEELPDPDKVRNARQMFQNVVKFARREDHIIMLPISAKLYNSTPIIDAHNKPRITPEVRVIDSIKSSKEKLDKGSETDLKSHETLKRSINKKWTDTGSLSSGVSSDMSYFDNELDCNESHKEIFSSEEDEGQEFYCQESDTHPVSPEVMNKIRACGTSVTYYGGRVIAHTNGPARSPMTMTIMDEIRQTGSSEESRRYMRSGDQYMGVKFRLVKSNSCGSRLELAGTGDEIHEISKVRFHEDMYGPAKSLGEELAECRGRMEPIEDTEQQDERPRTKETFIKVQRAFEEKTKKGDSAQPVQSWRALIESRKQNRSMLESHRPCSDMEFEEFEVLEG